APADERRHAPPRGFVAERHLGRAGVHAAVDGRVVGADRPPHGVDHRLRLLRGGGGIEVVPRRAVGVAEAGKIALQILPGRGRWQPAGLTEGVPLRALRRPGAPSTILRMVPLPVPGRIWQALAHALSPSAASAASSSASRSPSSSTATKASATNARTSSFCAI